MLFEPETHNFQQGRNHNSSPRPGHRRGQLGERGGQRRVGGGVGEGDHQEHQQQQTGVEDAAEQRRRDQQQKQRHHGLLNSSAGYKSGK